jgi:hypothetical protein
MGMLDTTVSVSDQLLGSSEERTDNEALAGDLPGKALDWTGDLIDLAGVTCVSLQLSNSATRGT